MSDPNYDYDDPYSGLTPPAAVDETFPAPQSEQPIQANIPPANTAAEREKDRVVGAGLKDNQFISLQDMNHASLGIRQGLIKMVPSLARNGVKHLFLENSKDGYDQVIMDQYRRGDITKQDVINYFVASPYMMWVSGEKDKLDYANAMADLLELCKQCDIKVWCSDRGVRKSSGELTAGETLLVAGAEEVGKTDVDNCQQLEIDPVFGLLMIPVLPWLPALKYNMMDFTAWLLDTRAEANEPAVQFALDKARDSNGNPEKAAFFWGGAHSNNTIGARDMDEMLAAYDSAPGNKVTNIAIYASQRSSNCSLGADGTEDTKGRDTDYFFYAKEDTITRNANYSETPLYKDTDDFKKKSIQEMNDGMEVARQADPLNAAASGALAQSVNSVIYGFIPRWGLSLAGYAILNPLASVTSGWVSTALSTMGGAGTAIRSAGVSGTLAFGTLLTTGGLVLQGIYYDDGDEVGRGLAGLGGAGLGFAAGTAAGVYGGPALSAITASRGIVAGGVAGMAAYEGSTNVRWVANGIGGGIVDIVHRPFATIDRWTGSAQTNMAAAVTNLEKLGSNALTTATQAIASVSTNMYDATIGNWFAPVATPSTVKTTQPQVVA